jgi:hypothetical protein
VRSRITIFGCIFFWGLGIICLVLAIYSGITGKGLRGQTFIIVESENFFIRYSVQLMFAMMSLCSILLPIFGLKGYMVQGSKTFSKYAKARSEFILYTLFFLGMFFAFLGGGYGGTITSAGKIVAVIFIIFYLYKVGSFIKAYGEKESSST